MSKAERDVTIPTMREWLDHLKQDARVEDVSSEDIVNAIHEAREERTEQIIRALTKRD
jgi:hypothetical protein